MDRLVKYLLIPAIFLCCCIHSTSQKDSSKGRWGAWGVWSQCTTTCGYGMQTRTRTWAYASGEQYSSEEPYTGTDIIQCFPKHCPVNGSWTLWGIWGECNKGCGGGVRKRHRSCTEPEPANGGANCTGKMFTEGECHKTDCPPLPMNFNTSQCSSGSMFTCASKLMCVPMTKHCNGEADCHDGTDEVGCRRSNIGHVRFSNASTYYSSSCILAVLVSSWFIKLFVGGQWHSVDQSALRP